MLNCSEASLGYRPLFTGGLCDFFFCFVQFLQADHLILGILQSQIIFFKILIGVQYESCGMLISAVHHEEGEEKLHLLMLDNHIPAGAKMY